MKIEESEPDRKKKWFLWGTVLTWMLTVPLIIGVFNGFNGFKGISEQKATGLGAIAGSLADAYVILGLILAFVLPVGAIVLLARSFSKGHPIRALFSLLHISWSALTLALAGLAVWVSFRR